VEFVVPFPENMCRGFLLNRSYTCSSRVYLEQHDSENNISSSDSLFQSSLESPASDLNEALIQVGKYSMF
jgi:hypothetical protein